MSSCTRGFRATPLTRPRAERTPPPSRQALRAPLALPAALLSNNIVDVVDRRRDANLAQGIAVAVLGLLSTGWGWLMYRNVTDALRSGFQGLVLALFTTALFIMITGMLAKRRERQGRP
jgi:hypothetical protein